MSSKAKAIFVAALLVTGVAGVFWIVNSGWTGYSLLRVAYFEGGTSQDAGAGANVGLGVRPKIECGMWPRSKDAFDLEIGFNTDTADALVRTAVVQSLIIRYKDGRTFAAISPTQPKLMLFELRRSSNLQREGMVYHDSLAVGVIVTNAVTRHEAFNVECEGMLVDEAARQFPFSAFWALHPRKKMGFVPNYYLGYLEPDVWNSNLPRP